MGNVIFLAGARGGAGATTCAYYLGCALSLAGERTLIADGDSACGDGLQVSGMSGLNVYTLADAQKGACRVRQAILKHEKQINLFLLPSLNCTDGEFISRAVCESAETFDYILCDGCASSACRRAIIMTEPYPSSIKAADKKIARLKDGGLGDVGIIVNKVNGGLVCNGEIMSPQEISSLLRCPLLGVIPEDLGMPMGKCGRAAAKAFKMTADVVAGRSAKIYGVTARYRGLGGSIKRKLRNFV